MTAWHPWRTLRSRPEVLVDITPDLPPGRLGDTDGCNRIRLAPDLLQTERRCTLTHELIHLERGDVDCTVADEQRVRRETARRLITLPRLADALLWAGHNLEEAADELWVDQDTLAARLEHLHPSERGYLLRRLSMKEHTA